MPLPWSGDAPPFGFSPAGASRRRGCRSRPTGRGSRSTAQNGDPARCWSCTGRALRQRRREPDLGDGPLTWLAGPDGVLAFRRGARLICLVNLSTAAADCRRTSGVILASGPLAPDGGLPPDTAVWLRI